MTLRTTFLSLLFVVATLAVAAAPLEIAPGVHLLRGEFVPGRQPDGNTILFEAKNGLVVVDTGRHETHTRAILDFAVARKTLIVAVVNTHWHLDHIGGNALIRREVPGARIYASPALDEALKGFLANYARQLQEVIAGAKEGSDEQKAWRTELGLIESGRQLMPDEAVASSRTLTIAGRELAVNLETRAVTAGDLWLFDAKSGTLVAGDLITLPYPFLDTACPSRWKDALGRLAAVKFERLVPGHGAPMTRVQFDQYRTAFDRLLACGSSTRTNEECASGWLSHAGSLVDKGEHAFVRQALDYYIDNFLRPTAKTDHLCGG